MSGRPKVRNVLPLAQQRFEQTMLGEIAISVLVSLILLIAVAWSSPESAFRRAVVPVVEPVAVASGLDQAWYMFSPDPIRGLEIVEVHARTASGEERVWTFPTGGAADQFGWYHWHKLKEQAVRNEEIRADLTRWVARRLLEPADYPAEVSMLLTTSEFSPPGEWSAAPSAVTEVLYTETFPGPP